MSDLKSKFEATVSAMDSLILKALVENQDIISRNENLTQSELEKIQDNILEYETNKTLILNYIISNGFVNFNQIQENFNIDSYKISLYILELIYEGLIGYKQNDELLFSESPAPPDLDDEDIYKLSLNTHYNRKRDLSPIDIIVSNDLCIACGLCHSVCPVDAILIDEEYPIIDKNKCIKCGLCNLHCPRTLFPINLLKAKVDESKIDFFESINKDEIGKYRKMLTARSKDSKILEVCQDGGVVTALLKYLFEQDKIDGALVSKKVSPDSWKPKPFIAKNIHEVLDAAGTKYANCKTLSALIEIKNSDCERIAVVGTPCQVQALRKYQLYSSVLTEVLDKIQIIIGIFCMESFTYENIKKISEKLGVPINEVEKMNIDKGKFFIHKRGSTEPVSIPIKEVTSLARQGCHYCIDLTNELADISVGSIASSNGWSTLIVRTNKGIELFNAIKESDYLEIKKIDPEKPYTIPLLIKLANGKRIRNYKKAKEIADDSPKYYYKSLKDLIDIKS
ncbi:MAG: 4Fe-4S dicluster domain-containing protein [Candidatus Lokiarchaeota archaeon]|nr:4Fe-4S dicluster domain-containing protein [Candidatus Lokiarchaeota archaeon]